MKYLGVLDHDERTVDDAVSQILLVAVVAVSKKNIIIVSDTSDIVPSCIHIIIDFT